MHLYRAWIRLNNSPDFRLEGFAACILDYLRRDVAGFSFGCPLQDPEYRSFPGSAGSGDRALTAAFVHILR